MKLQTVIIVVPLCFLAVVVTASAQPAIRVTISNKDGDAHIGRKVVYNMSAVSVGDDAIDIPLLDDIPIDQRTVQSDGTGLLTIPLYIAQLTDPKVQEIVDYSKQITLHLYPQVKSNSPDLADVDIDLLLGDKPQDIHIVMMTQEQFKAGMQDALAYAFESPRGRFHLIGEVGTALYRTARGNWRLVEIEKYSEDDRHLYFREVTNPNRRWAFSPGTVRYSRQNCGCSGWQRSYQKFVWTANTDESSKWRVFSRASRIEANRDD